MSENSALPATANSPLNAAKAPLGASEDNAWNPLTRAAFRFVSAYEIQYALCSGHKTVLERLPLMGRPLQNILFAPYNLASLYLARHAFHLSGASLVPHGSGFGDRAVDWIAAGLMLLIALGVTVVWSLLDRKTLSYQQLYAWLRFLLRLTLGISMLWYASIKLFPIQIESPSLAVLNEPLGQTSPMTLLWSLLGLSHGYERICGLAELTGGLLILYRRTALAGAMISAFIIANIFIFNLFFDVAVKLYSFNLLLMCLIVIAPDASALFRLFWTHEPSAPTSVWVPPAKRRSFQQATAVIEVVFLISCLNPMRASHRQFAQEQWNVAHPSPLAGQWRVEKATLDGQPHPFLTGDGVPMTDLFLEPSGRDTVRAEDGTLWTGGRYDVAPNSLWILTPAREGLTYSISQAGPDHIVLTPASDAQVYPVIELSRVPIASHHRIYDRGYHWINEWGFER